MLHTALRYSIDLRSFLHGEKAGTYTDYEPLEGLIRQLYHAIRRHGLAKYYLYYYILKYREKRPLLPNAPTHFRKEGIREGRILSTSEAS
jgi:hypothetical protein